MYMQCQLQSKQLSPDIDSIKWCQCIMCTPIFFHTFFYIIQRMLKIFEKWKLKNFPDIPESILMCTPQSDQIKRLHILSPTYRVQEVIKCWTAFVH